MQQLEVVTVERAVPVHGRQQDLARTQADSLPGPLHRIAVRGAAAAVAEHLPAVPAFAPPRIDRQHDALRPKYAGASSDQLRISESGAVDRRLVSAMSQQLGHVIHAANTATHRQRDEYLVGR